MSVLRLPSMTLTLIAIAPIFLLAAASRLLALPEGVVSVVSIITLIWAIAFAMFAWFRLDETAKEAHKFAWLYGSFALVALMLACLFTPLPAIAREQIVEPFLAANPGTPWRPASYGFLTGVVAAVLAQTAGWAIVWAGWWIARRR